MHCCPPSQRPTPSTWNREPVHGSRRAARRREAAPLPPVTPTRGALSTALARRLCGARGGQTVARSSERQGYARSHRSARRARALAAPATRERAGELVRLVRGFAQCRNAPCAGQPLVSSGSAPAADGVSRSDLLPSVLGMAPAGLRAVDAAAVSLAVREQRLCRRSQTTGAVPRQTRRAALAAPRSARSAPSTKAPLPRGPWAGLSLSRSSARGLAP